MGGGEGFPGVFPPRRVDSLAIAQPGRDPGLIQGDPERNRVTERLVHDPGVLGKPLAGLPARPAAPVLKDLREIPMVQGEHRLDGARPESVHEPAVEVEALLVGRAAALGLDARPGDGEAVRAQTEICHEVEVLFDAVVVVAGYVAGVAAVDLARCVGEGVPDRGSAPVLVHGPLDLVGRRRGAPQEVLREVHLASFTPRYTGRFSLTGSPRACRVRRSCVPPARRSLRRRGRASSRTPYPRPTAFSTPPAL